MELTIMIVFSVSMVLFNLRLQMIPRYRVREWHTIPITFMWMIYFTLMAILIARVAGCD